MFWKRDHSSAHRTVAEKSLDDSHSSSTEGRPQASPSANISGKDADFGTIPSIKTFYEGKGSGNGHFNWVDSPPKQLNKKVAKANNRVAIKIYKIKDHEQETISGRTPLKIHLVELQSPILVAALKGIVKDENVFLEATETAKFQEPFKPLFFCYDKIMALYEKTELDGVLKQHLRLLVQVMGDLFGGFMSQLKNLRASGLISYKLAWTYFPRDNLVYCGSEDCMRVGRAVDTQYICGGNGQPPRMVINCEEIAFDGMNVISLEFSLSLTCNILLEFVNVQGFFRQS